jgi:hypothetical protein
MKGQISLDLIFILIVVLIFIGTMSAFAENFRQTYEETLLKNQLRTLSSNYATFITKTQTITDSNFITKIKIDEINYIGKRYLLDLNFMDNLLTTKISNSEQEEKDYFSNESIIVYQENNYLVIKNE